MYSNIDINTTSKGLNTDVSFDAIPKGAYPYALNGVLYSTENDIPYMYNEAGNYLCWDKPETYKILGHAVTEKDTFILLIKTTDSSIIGEYDPQLCIFNTIIDSPCLNFNSNYPIKIEFRFLRGCDRVIYFTDNLNPVRVINLSDTSRYYDEQGNFDCSRINYSLTYSYPLIVADRIDDGGGNLKVGSYQFALQYIDDDGNYSSFIAISHLVTIVDDSLSSDYYHIDGGVNYVNDLTEEGAVSRSNKRITLKITNLDTKYRYFKLAIIAYTSATGVASEVYLTTPIPYAGTEIEYVVSSLSDTNLTTITPADIQNDVVTIERAKYISSVDSRLIIVGPSYKLYDWGEVQRAAQKIIIQPYFKRIDKFDKSIGPKSPLSSLYVGYMRDEVYAFGIVGIFKDGRRTPVFHIPGRESAAVDVVPVTIVTDDTVISSLTQVHLKNVRHLGYDETDIGSTVPRWKITNSVSTPNSMAYWESDVPYPDHLTCSGERVYPYGNIRHHRFPSIYVNGLEDDTGLYILGFTANINDFLAYIPTDLASEIVEWRVVRAARDSFNRTISDKGVLLTDAIVPSETTDTEYAFVSTNDVYTIQSNQRHISFNFISPKALLNRSAVGGSYIYGEKRTFHTKQYETTSHQGVVIRHNHFKIIPSYASTYSFHRYHNYLLQGYAYIDRINALDGKELDEIGNTILEGNYAKVGNSKIFNFSTSVHQLHLVTVDDFTFYENPTEPQYVYASIKTGNTKVHAVLENIEYYDIPSVDGVYYGGDTYIGYFAIRDSYIYAYHLSGGPAVVESNFYYTTVIESEVNPELRHSNQSDWLYGTYYREDPEDFDKVISYQRGVVNEDDELVFFFPEYFGYNSDFSPKYLAKKYFPLPRNYRYCNSCDESLPNLYYASEKSYQNDILDNFRIILASNYSIVPLEYGNLVAVKEWNNRLFLFTDKNLLVQPIRPQEINTDVSTAYLSSGSILSVPPTPIFNSQYAHGGCQDWRSIFSFDSGLIYADTFSNKIFLITSSPNELSASGMSKWARKNVKFYLNEAIYIATSGTEYFFKDLVGIQAAFNPETRSVVITKNDWEILNGQLPILSNYDNPTQDGIYFSSEGKFILVSGNSTQRLSVTDSLYFINRGFTISYNTLFNTWQSFHSYIPEYIMNNSRYLISAPRGSSGLWIHNYTSNRGSFYGRTFPFIIELVSRDTPITQKNFHSIKLLADVKRLDTTGLNTMYYDVYDTFFDSIIAYTRTSSTGQLNLEVSNSIFSSSSLTTSIVKRVENKWRIDNLPNRVTNYDIPMFSDQWSDIYYAYPIDKVPNTAAFGQLNLLNVSRLSGEWLACRFIFSNEVPNTLISINLAEFKHYSYPL